MHCGEYGRRRSLNNHVLAVLSANVRLPLSLVVHEFGDEIFFVFHRSVLLLGIRSGLRRLDPSPAAPLASDDFITLLERAFALAIFTWSLLFSDALPHGVLQIRSLEYTAERRRHQTRSQLLSRSTVTSSQSGEGSGIRMCLISNRQLRNSLHGIGSPRMLFDQHAAKFCHRLIFQFCNTIPLKAGTCL
jgi:hypothetical protein